jgi:hypothetical protein
MTKSFAQIREKKKMPPGDHVYDKKVGKYQVMIHKTNKGYVLYIDGEKLDTYKSQKEAEKMGMEFIKQYKGM